MYIGTSALSPSGFNYNGYNTWAYTASSSGFSVSLTAGKYYPLLLYWGNMYANPGGSSVGLGYSEPGESSVSYDGTGKFFNLNDVEGNVFSSPYIMSNTISTITTTGSTFTARAGSASIIYNGNGYIFGGISSDSTILDDVMKYSIIASTWLSVTYTGIIIIIITIIIIIIVITRTIYCPKLSQCHPVR